MTQPLLGPDGGEGTSPPPLLTAKAVAARLRDHKGQPDPVTEQTVRNWRAAGMKRQGKLPVVGGGRLGEHCDGFSVEAVEKWRAANRPAGRNGGMKRKGAGRPRGGSKAARQAEMPLVAAAQAAHGEDQVKANQEAAERERKRQARLDARAQIMRGGRATIDVLMDLATATEDEGGASRADLDRVSTAIKAAKDQQELEQRRGELVSAAEQRAVWATLLTNLKLRLETLPARVGPMVAAACALRTDQVQAVQLAVRGVVERLMTELEEDARSEDDPHLQQEAA